MWYLGTWVTDSLGSAGGIAVLDLGGLFQPEDFMTKVKSKVPKPVEPGEMFAVVELSISCNCWVMHVWAAYQCHKNVPLSSLSLLPHHRAWARGSNAEYGLLTLWEFSQHTQESKFSVTDDRWLNKTAIKIKKYLKLLSMKSLQNWKQCDSLSRQGHRTCCATFSLQKVF